jgi:hypothetical protein
MDALPHDTKYGTADCNDLSLFRALFSFFFGTVERAILCFQW